MTITFANRLSPKLLALLLLLLVLVSPLLGCAAVVGSGGSGEQMFASYISGENPERYCEQQVRQESGVVSTGCVHEVIVFDRARNACRSSLADRSCIIRNQQRWQQEVEKARELVQQLAGDDYDGANFHEQMRTPAERFVMRCKQADGELISCAETSF